MSVIGFSIIMCDPGIPEFMTILTRPIYGFDIPERGQEGNLARQGTTWSHRGNCGFSRYHLCTTSDIRAEARSGVDREVELFTANRGLANKGGKLVQPIQLTINHAGMDAKLVVRVDYHEVESRVLSSGTHKAQYCVSGEENK